MSDTPLTNEIKINVSGQWYFRGNRSPVWFALASRSDGSASGIADRLPQEAWEFLEIIAAEHAKHKEEMDEAKEHITNLLHLVEAHQYEFPEIRQWLREQGK